MTIGRIIGALVVVCALWVYLDPGVPSVLTAVVLVALLVRILRRTAFPRLAENWEKVRPVASSARTARERGERSRRQEGLASRAQVREHGSARAVRAKLPVVRPTLAHLGRLEQWRHVRTTDVGVLLCKVGATKVYASLEDVVAHFGGPRVGKTGWAAGAVVDFPGPLIATSVRPDLWQNTARFRAARGPVMVFNAAGITNVEGEVTFDPLTDCINPESARERAHDMIPAPEGSASGDRAHWAGLARGALASFLHAAAHGGHTMDDVLQWTAKPKDHHAVIVKALRKSKAEAMLHAAEHFIGTNDRTQSSITSSMTGALEWLSSSTARAAAGLDGHRRPFRVESLLADTASLYVIGRIDVNTEPLLAALTGYIARAARRYAVVAPTGRLDPPLGLMLDEAARLGVPLPDWTSDMGGSGITILACFQSLAQLVAVWGQEGADTVLNNTGAVMLGGGTKAAHDLQAWTELAGDRDERSQTTDAHGGITGTTRRAVPVLPPAQLTALPPKHVVLWRRGMPPALGTTQMVWERRDLHPGLARRLLRLLATTASSASPVSSSRASSSALPLVSSSQEDPPRLPADTAAAVAPASAMEARDRG